MPPACASAAAPDSERCAPLGVGAIAIPSAPLASPPGSAAAMDAGGSFSAGAGSAPAGSPGLRLTGPPPEPPLDEPECERCRPRCCADALCGKDETSARQKTAWDIALRMSGFLPGQRGSLHKCAACNKRRPGLGSCEFAVHHTSARRRSRCTANCSNHCFQEPPGNEVACDSVWTACSSAGMALAAATS